MTSRHKRGGVGRKQGIGGKNNEDGDLGTYSLATVKNETSKLENFLRKKRRLENALIQKELATQWRSALKSILTGKSKKGKEVAPVDSDCDSKGEDQDGTDDDDDDDDNDAETEVDSREIGSRETKNINL